MTGEVAVTVTSSDAAGAVETPGGEPAGAEILGVSQGTVKSRCARGRARLLPRLAHLRRAPDRPPAPGRPQPPGNRSAG